MKAKIRKAQEDDIGQMAVLLCELFSLESDFTPDPNKHRQGLLQRLVQTDSWLILVAETEGQVVGMCSMHMLTSTSEGSQVGMIEDVVVTATHWGQGVGRRLLEAVEAFACKLGLCRLQLLTDSGNQSALDFYSHLGWRKTHMICLRKTRDAMVASLPL